MTALNYRPMHHDNRDDDVAAASTSVSISHPISIRHGGGDGIGDASLGHSTSTSASSLPTTTTTSSMPNVIAHRLRGESSSDSSGGGGEENTSCKQKNKIMNTANKEQPHNKSSAWSRRQHQRRRQQQQQQQHAPRLYYPYLIILLIISFLSMSFSPFLVYNFLPDHHHHHHPTSSSSISSSASSFTLDSVLSSPVLEQQFHPKRITTAVITSAAESDIDRSTKKEEHQQQQRHGDFVSNASVVSKVPSPIILSDNKSNSTVPRNDSSLSSLSATTIIRPLRPGIDYEQYTVRINTWKRPAQLRVVLEHLSSKSCRSSIAQIQVIWCLAQGPVPEWLLQFNNQNHNGMDSNNDDDYTDFIVVEIHDENSLNERFNVSLEPPTYGVLSVDDDVIRPCLALDVAFVKWTRNPHRMVGFDARSHVVIANNKNINNNTDNKSKINNNNHQVWAYGYLSTTQNMNRYSSSLTRFAFMHVDYLHSYMTHMPAQIRQIVANNLNCEDIAMSFWISKQASLYSYASSSSSLSQQQQQLLLPPPPQPPLLADLWVMQSQVKLATGEKSISAGKDHKKMRDACVNDFANWLQLKGHLKLSEWVHYENATATTTSSNHLRGGGNEDADKTTKKSVFECGAPMDMSIAAAASEHVRDSLTARVVTERMNLWKDNMNVMLQELKQLSADTRRAAKNQLLTST